MGENIQALCLSVRKAEASVHTGMLTDNQEEASGANDEEWVTWRIGTQDGRDLTSLRNGVRACPPHFLRGQRGGDCRRVHLPFLLASPLSRQPGYG